MSTSDDNRLDVRDGPDGTKKGVCNLVAISQFSNNNRGSYTLNPSSYEVAFAIDLAIKHLNERDGSIVKDIEKLKGTCDIEFAGEYIDTEDDAITASQRVNERLEEGFAETEKDSSVGPVCALIGATSSYSENIQTSVVANIRGHTLVSGMNHGTVFDHPSNYPRFARTIPSTVGAANAFARYVNQTVGYGHLVIMHADTDHSEDYATSIRKAMSNYIEDGVLEIVVQNDGSNIEWAIKRLKVLNITTVIATFEGSSYTSNLYDNIMKEAFAQKVAGHNNHIWFYPESLFEYSSYFQNLRNIDGDHDPLLFDAYKGAGVIKSGETDFKYHELIREIKKQAESSEYMDYMQSVLPNPFSDTNSSNATRDMMNEKSFLTEHNIDSRIQFVYDATVIAGLSACSATKDLYLSGDDLYSTLVRYNYTGVSGLVTLDNRTGSRIIDSSSYSIWNIRPMNLSSNDDFQLEIRKSSIITNESMEQVEPFVYNSGQITKPEAVWKTQIITNLADADVISVESILCILSLALSVISAVWTYKNRNTRIIRASQAFFLYLICLGTIFVALSMTPSISSASVKMNNFTSAICCNMHLWLLTIGISLIISSLYSKLYRINKIMKAARECKRITVKVKDAILPVIITMSLTVLILVVMTSIDKMDNEPIKTDYDIFLRETEVQQKCDIWTKRWPTTVSFLALDTVLFILTGYEAYKARDLSTEFQENRAIIRCLVVLFFSASVGFPVFFLNNDTVIQTCVLTIQLFILCLSINAFLFGEKYLYQRDLAQQQPCGEEEGSSEKLLSNQGQHQLAFENLVLRKRVEELEGELILRKRTSA